MESLQPPPSAVISVPSSPSVTSLQPQSTQSTTTICNIPPPAVTSVSCSPSVTSPQPQSTQFITTIHNTDCSYSGPTVTLSEPCWLHSMSRIFSGGVAEGVVLTETDRRQIVPFISLFLVLSSICSHTGIYGTS